MNAKYLYGRIGTEISIVNVIMVKNGVQSREKIAKQLTAKRNSGLISIYQRASECRFNVFNASNIIYV